MPMKTMTAMFEPGRIAHDPRHGLLLPADGMRGSDPFSVVMLFNPTSLECEHYGEIPLRIEPIENGGIIPIRWPVHRGKSDAQRTAISCVPGRDRSDG